MEAYKHGLAEIRYDPLEERVCFLPARHGIFYGAWGRYLGNQKETPKWFNYVHNYRVPFTVTPYGQSDTVVLVEDCASACAVAVPMVDKRMELLVSDQDGKNSQPNFILHSLALGGVNFNFSWLPDIKPYKVVVVALDPDALAKGYDLHRSLSVFKPCKVWVIPKDLKYFNQEEIRKLAHDAGIIGTKNH